MKHHSLPALFSLQVEERWASNLLLAWQDSSELRQLLSQLSCAGERSGRGETLPAGAEEGSRCVIPFCSLDGRDHRANSGHKGSSAPLKSHMPPEDNRSSYSRLAKHAGSWQPAVAEPVPELHRGLLRKDTLLTEVPGLPRGHREPGTPVTAWMRETPGKLHKALNNPWAILCHSKTLVRMRNLTTENSSDALVGSKKQLQLSTTYFFSPSLRISLVS